jgi:hypothetical protein
MQYHPSADGLQENGYPVELAKSVHIPEAAQFVNPRHDHEQPWSVMHELAHAYHDRELGFDEPRILAAYQEFCRQPQYTDVLHVAGEQRRHYALTNEKEFFAEHSEAYLGTNDFYPFVRGELLQAEPALYRLLQDIWGAAPR